MFIFALTPIVAYGFPLLVPLITAAAGGLGYKVVTSMKEGGDINRELQIRLQELTTISLPVEEQIFDAMEKEVSRAQSLYFEKDGITLALIKDERKNLRVEVTGQKNADPQLLRQRGQEFIEELAQMFAQNQLVEQLERINAEVAEEEQLENGDVLLKINRWT
jgi:hypothetical protein